MGIILFLVRREWTVARTASIVEANLNVVDVAVRRPLTSVDAYARWLLHFCPLFARILHWQLTFTTVLDCFHNFWRNLHSLDSFL